VGFYTVGTGTGFEGSFPDRFLKLAEQRYTKSIDINGVKYEFRDLSKEGQCVRGYVSRLRYSDLPHAAAPGGTERELALAEDEGLIEKNYFRYYAERNLLVFQHHGYGTTTYQLSNYLAQLFSETITMNPIIQADAMQRIMSNDIKPKMLELSISKPSAKFVPETDFSKEAMEMMNSSNGLRLYLRVSLGRSKEGKKRYLANIIKDSVSELFETGILSVARLNVSEDGDTHPIDLISDRITAMINVQTNGRYPVASSVYRELEDAWNSNRSIIDESCGSSEESLL
jgi:hypothetical protein